MLNLPGYIETNLLYTGTRTLVYRAIGATDGQPVIIKVLRNHHPSFKELVQFRNQYVITRNLENPRIVRSMALERYGNSYAIVMPDSGAIALSDYWHQSERNLIEFLDLAIQLSVALHYLNEQRIVHKDIKPSNIVINPETRQIQLIDFSISSLLPREQQELTNPKVLEGTLAYISPEQTGRMNRGIDYRTDFYSLGVTFYELLTGKLPFAADDPMELVHCHIAKTPRLEFKESGNLEKIPQVLGDIVLKLMAKNAEDRYQSALGLKHDLERCLQQWSATGEITPFELAERDLSDRFLIPEKLYGREKEVQTLLDAFERVANPPLKGDTETRRGGDTETLPPVPASDHTPRTQKGGRDGQAEMMLVAGFSGIGKTTVVNEVHKPIVRQRGYFIKGKFDQFNRNIPLSAFVQAFRDLMGQLLSESDAELGQWKAKILEVVGENGQVLIEVIPELETLIGKQPPVPELSGSATQNRFNLLFQKFIGVLTTPSHPLVMFLDDLQWVDSASLNLIKVLMTGTEMRHLLLLGAYRDNEVFPGHPLAIALRELEKEQAVISTITLAPLSLNHINQLVAETLSCNDQLALPLTELVYQKTQGNPFFTTQFLKGLHQDKLIQFNYHLGYWECDLSRVRDASMTDDVVEFMAGRLLKLQEATQNVLKLAACIGNQFELETLVVVCDQPQEEVAARLWGALQEGLVLPVSESYKFLQGRETDERQTESIVSVSYRFLHDRVQQAAYSLIPELEKEKTHLKIGQLLLEKIPESQRVEKIFVLVNQLNYGAKLIVQVEEREQLAQLNLVAGTKAKVATAYSAAVGYFAIGRELLQEDCWDSQYELTLALSESAAEAAYLNGEFEAMEALVDEVLDRGKTLLHKVKAYQVQIQAKIACNQLLSAVQTGLEVLKLLDVTFPESPEFSDVGKALEETKLNLAGTKIEELINLPEMIDPVVLAAMQLSNSIFGAAYLAVPPLMPLIALKQVNLSLKYGNTSVSAFAYVNYGLLLCALVGDMEGGVAFGQLSLKVLSQLQAKNFEARVVTNFNIFIQHRQQHLRSTLKPLLEAYACGLETGDLEFAAYAAYNYCRNLYFLGTPLLDVKREFSNYNRGVEQLKQQATLNYGQICLQVVCNLIEKGGNYSQIEGANYSEATMLPFNDRYALFCLSFNKLMLCYLFGEYESGVNQGNLAASYLDAATGMPEVAIFYCYDSLTRLGLYESASNVEQKVLLENVESNQEKMQKCADNAPMNYLHKLQLVEAEKYRVLGKKMEVMELYDQAIAGAKENGFLQEEALSNELAAKFYLDNSKEKIAATYMQEAYYCYARWGSQAKTDQLQEKYPQLLAPILQPPYLQVGRGQTATLITLTQTAGSSSSKTDFMLDWATAMKAAQSLSKEIHLEKLVSALMKAAMENAGADRGILLLEQPEGWQVAARCSWGENGDLRLNEASDECALPTSVINQVKHSQQPIIVNDFPHDTKFAADSYLWQEQPNSFLCAPILNQGKLIGILYLENHLAVGAFTSDRLELLELVSAQAAISLENARLYHRLEEYSHTLEAQVERRTQELKQKNQDLQQTLVQLQRTQAQLIQTEKMSSLGQMVAGIAHEINNPITFISGNIGYASEYVQDLLDLLALYEEESLHPSEAIQEKTEEINLEFLRSDLAKLFASMRNGSDRIKNIILGLRNFSRLDESDRKLVDIHAGLENTLAIVQHRFKAGGDRPEIAIVKNYGKLPLVNCYASQLNQAFLHILTNAIDVLTASNSGSCPEICIATEMLDAQTVRISIADNGQGMSANVCQKIFDPFFTTKPVGKGTGLGLSISYQIVTEQHGGKLHCISQPGVGTELAIDIPLSGL